MTQSLNSYKSGFGKKNQQVSDFYFVDETLRCPKLENCAFAIFRDSNETFSFKEKFCLF